MSDALLGRIADGRTDLVFEHLAAGNAATAIGRDGLPLIGWCARYGDVSAIRHLVANGETLRTLGENFGLGGASYHGHWRLGEYLIDSGADANAADPATGETPLHLALCKPNRPAFDLVVQVLLAAGADPNRTTRPGVETGSFMRDARTRGETPLHRAAAFSGEATIRRLLEHGAAIDARDMNGDTPLAWASWHTRPDAILRLLCHGSQQIHPDRNSTFDHGTGWSHMELDLQGHPRATGRDDKEDRR